MTEQQRPRVVPGGRIKRAAPLLGAASRTAGEAVVASMRRRKGKDSDLHLRAAERYARQLGRSKGVLMKAGQLLSFVSFAPTMDDQNQRIYQAALARLQDDAPPMPYEVARGMVIAELGAPPEELFAEFGREPLAAASIGQVHAATTHDGRRVAVKVQYPGVEQAIRADLDNAELLATFFRLIRPMAPDLTRMDVRALAREVSDRIGEEIDYRAEAKNQSEFAGAYRGHPLIRVPEVVPELSTGRVFTTELSDGVRWSKALEADQDLRDRWGEVIYRFSIGSLRRLGLFNADPHPGNYLFHPDGTVTFLDFGCIKHFSAEQRRYISRFVTAAVDGDAERVYAGMRDAGFVEEGAGDLPTPEELMAWFHIGLRPLIAPQPFTYTREFAAEAVRLGFSPTGPHGETIRRLTMNPDYLFLTRIDLGMTAVLGELNATGHWRAIADEWDRGGPPATPLGELDQAFWEDRHAHH
jgi:predicted unusual protein kinase regulating ubiquinone biosynthesis (AarF/ABC1/UbiB family)